MKIGMESPQTLSEEEIEQMFGIEGQEEEQLLFNVISIVILTC